MNLKTPPPEKLSDLLDLAITNARRLDHDRYTPMWMTWHRPGPLNDKCMVCLAGAVIAGTLGCPPQTTIDIATSDSADPESTTITDKRWRHALWALDSAREGHWRTAFEALHGSRPDGEMHDALEAIPVPASTEFHDWDRLESHLVSLSVCASRLRELGL